MDSNLIKYDIIKIEEVQEIISDKRLKPNSAKNLAIANGEVHFIGTSCKRNHNGLRYTKGGQCVDCVTLARQSSPNPRGRTNHNHEKSLVAASEGKTTYEPIWPCKKGHRLRFVNSNNCVECDKTTAEKHKISIKYRRIEKIYGLSKIQYLELVASQNSSCQLCGKYEEDHFKLHVDHCHDTSRVRSLLCPKCNQGIGLLNHDPVLIRKAALYCE